MPDGLGGLGTTIPSSGGPLGLPPGGPYPYPGGGSTVGIPGVPAAPGWQQILLGGLTGAGELGNILEGQKQQSYQNYLLKIMQNPALLAQMINKATAPLSQALTQNVTNSVQGNLATRGLGQAPGIFSSTESQALAPYVLQNQQQAENAVLSSLGAPAGTFQPPQNLTPLLSMFLRSFGTPGGGGGGGSPSGGANPNYPYGGPWSLPGSNTQGGGITIPPPDTGGGGIDNTNITGF